MCCYRAPSPLLSPSPTPITQGEHASTVISVLKHFGLGSLADKLLEADGVHVGNLLSLSCDMGFQFEHLCLWFEATDTVRYW